MFFLGISSRASLFNTRAAAYYCYLTVSLTFLDNLFIYGKKFVFYDKRISFPFTLNKKPWVFAVDNGCRWVEFSTRYFRGQRFPLSYERAGLLLMTWQPVTWVYYKIFENSKNFLFLWRSRSAFDNMTAGQYLTSAPSLQRNQPRYWLVSPPTSAFPRNFFSKIKKEILCKLIWWEIICCGSARQYCRFSWDQLYKINRKHNSLLLSVHPPTIL